MPGPFRLQITDELRKETTCRLLIRALNARCQAHQIPVPLSFAYPGNGIHPKALPLLRDLGIKFAPRGGAPEYPYKEGRGCAYEPGRDHPLLIRSAGDARPAWTLQDFQRAVQQARHGRIAVLQFHGVPDTAHDWVSTSQAQFESYLRYLAENRYHVIALRDLAKYVDPDLRPQNAWDVIEIANGFWARKSENEGKVARFSRFHDWRSLQETVIQAEPIGQQDEHAVVAHSATGATISK